MAMGISGSGFGPEPETKNIIHMEHKIQMRFAFVFFVVVFGFSAPLAFAQDGSSAGGASTLAEATSSTAAVSTPRSVGSSSPAVSAPRPSTPSPQPPPIFAATTSSPVAVVIAPTPLPEALPNNAGNGFGTGALALLASAAVLALGGYGVFRLKTQKNNQKKQEEKKDDSRCLNIKKLADAKFRELTDLKGQLQSRAEEKGREILRQAVSGTRAGKILANVEKAEAEYQKLKKLLSECEFEFSKKKNAILLHGTGDSPELFWFPYLKENLEKRGFSVWAPLLPNAKKPNLEDWLTFVLKEGTFNEETILVGHSSGARLILSILDSIDVTVKQAILVSSFARILRKRMDDTEDGEEPHWENIRRHVKSLTFINSDNDPWGCDDTQGRILHDHLGGELIVRHDGHMGSTTHNQPYREFPLLLNLIAK